MVKFRWKLTLIMLAVSILPIVLLRTFGIHHVRSMAEALSEEVRRGRSEAARSEILSLVENSRQALKVEQERIEMALFFLADLLRRETLSRLKDCPDPIGPVDPALRPGAAARLLVLIPEPADPRQRCEAAGLARASATFGAIAEHQGDIVRQQNVAFSSGVAASYPSWNPGVHVGDALRESWYREAFVESAFSWSKPFWDPAAGGFALSISARWEEDDDPPAGVASITVGLDRLLERMLAFSKLPSGAHAFLCTLDQNPAARSVGLKILADSGSPSSAGPRWLRMPEAGPSAMVVEDAARRSQGLVRMPFEGRDAFWAYTPLPHQGSILMLICPAADLLQPETAVQADIQARLLKVERLTAGFLGLLAVVNVLFVLGFSRSVTRPLEALARAADRLAQGDFESRVAIGSKDEFGAMGTVFNRVGPQLKAHFRVREALRAAVEIQQGLLPTEPPSIAGLDIFAMSLYSENIGGDYHDYLCVREGGRLQLCVVVGDVSGHGIPSALTMATARAFLRLRASQPGTLGEIVTAVNRKFVEDVEFSGQFMTLFLARVDRENLSMEWVRAGHDPGLLYDSRRGEFRELSGQGAPLGLSDRIRFVESAAGIEPGQIIAIGTDGIWEARSPSGEMFGKERLMSLIRRYANESAKMITLGILDAVEGFRGQEEQADDMTLLVIRITDFEKG